VELDVTTQELKNENEYKTKTIAALQKALFAENEIWKNNN
jgi:hypothetical protein